jgi:tetratricopeptide (TPR) repeat protein
VQAVLAARIDRLSPEDKRLLQAAAVVGKDVPYPILQAVAELPEDSLRQGLARLQAAEFLYETSLFPDLEYTFKHALTHEVAYGSLLQERRRALHARIVDATEALHADRLAEQVERLAYHALRAEMWEKALAYARQAGARAASRSAYGEAVAHLEQSIAALERVPRTTETRKQAIDLRFELRHAMAAIGQRHEGLRLLLEAETLAEDLGDERRLGGALSTLANHYWGAAEEDRAIEAGERAQAIGVTLGDMGLQAAATLQLGRAYHALGDYQAAVNRLQRSVEATAGDLLHAYLGFAYLPSVAARLMLVHCHAERGEFRAALAAAQEGVAIAEAEGHAWSLIPACTGLGRAYVSQGRAAQALGPLERAVADCETWHIPLLFPGAATWLGYAYALSGRVAEAIQMLERSVKQAGVSGNIIHEVEGTRILGEAYLLAGRRDDAAAVATQGLALARARKQRGDEAWMLRLFGEIAAQEQPPQVEQAETHYREALALAQELGMCPLAAHCHLGLGSLYRELGRHEPAQAALIIAIDLYRTMEMTSWLEGAEAALAQLAC